MSYALTADQVDRYQRDGFLFPLDVFDSSRVANIVAALDEARMVAREKGLDPEIAQLLRANTHYILPFVSEVARAPQLLDRVDLKLHARIKQDQTAALAEGAEQDLHAAY